MAVALKCQEIPRIFILINFAEIIKARRVIYVPFCFAFFVVFSGVTCKNFIFSVISSISFSLRKYICTLFSLLAVVIVTGVSFHLCALQFAPASFSPYFHIYFIAFVFYILCRN